MYFNRDQKLRSLVVRWFLIWTAIGTVFSLQLYWHYGLSWSLSLFWGLADWYLWGILAVGIVQGVRHLRRFNLQTRSRWTLYAIATPVVAGIHVILTMIVGGVSDLPIAMDWLAYFQALYAKKLSLNYLTFGVLVAVSERLTSPVQYSEPKFFAKLGDDRRIVHAKEIFWAEVCGNHVNLHTADGLWPIRSTLTQLVQRLPTDGFVRINRSQLINLNRIVTTRSDNGKFIVTLVNGADVRVSRRFQPSVRTAIRDYSARGTKRWHV